METLQLLKEKRLSYPVGQYISENLPKIEEMTEVLGNFILEKFPKNKKILLTCMGSSGAMIAAVMSMGFSKRKKTKSFNVRVHHVKKDGESSHGSGYIDATYIRETLIVVVDDFICSGATILSVVNKIKDQHSDKLNNKSFDILCVTGLIPEDVRVKLDKEFKYAITSGKD